MADGETDWGGGATYTSSAGLPRNPAIPPAILPANAILYPGIGVGSIHPSVSKPHSTTYQLGAFRPGYDMDVTRTGGCHEDGDEDGEMTMI